MKSILQLLLLPFSLVYGLVMQVRNFLFDLNVLPQYQFQKPIICVGNLSCGGTGKTPLVEYLIRLLTPFYSIATLSRGYKRESKGFLMGNIRSNIKYLGDEPYQLLKKFSQIKVAVDEKRNRGIVNLLQRFPDLGVILLDDAFQHRYVKPGLSLLLTDFHNLYTADFVLPSGTLREFRSGARRADIIVVTKTPSILSPITCRRIREEINPTSRQKVFFSFIRYGDPLPFNSEDAAVFPAKINTILLFTGIANDYPLREHLVRKCSELDVVHFRDHHRYTVKDIENLVKKFDNYPTRRKVMVTTEKDLMRLKVTSLSTKLKNLPLFYVPIEMDFHGKDKDNFDNEIIKYVKKNQRDR